MVFYGGRVACTLLNEGVLILCNFFFLCMSWQDLYTLQHRLKGKHEYTDYDFLPKVIMAYNCRHECQLVGVVSVNY